MSIIFQDDTNILFLSPHFRIELSQIERDIEEEKAREEKKEREEESERERVGERVGERERGLNTYEKIDRERERVMRCLIEAGADINHVKKETGETPLMCALAERNIRGAKVLIEYGAKIDVKTKVCEREKGKKGRKGEKERRRGGKGERERRRGGEREGEIEREIEIEREREERESGRERERERTRAMAYFLAFSHIPSYHISCGCVSYLLLFLTLL